MRWSVLEAAAARSAVATAPRPLTAAAAACRRHRLPLRTAVLLQMGHSMQAVASARAQVLGRLFRLAATCPAPAPAALPAYQRAPLRCWAAASSAADLGSRQPTSTAAAASGPAPADVAAAADGAVPPMDAAEEGLEGAVGLPRKLGSEAAEAGGTGAFQRLPMVAPSKELLESAVKRAARVPYNKKLKNEAQKAKNRRGEEEGRGLGCAMHICACSSFLCIAWLLA